ANLQLFWNMYNRPAPTRRAARGWARSTTPWRCPVEARDPADDAHVEAPPPSLRRLMFPLVYFCEGKGEEMGFCLKKMRGS
ncbi:LOW QUALITY PROTEIN: NDRG4 isoform 51, partial [Pongo abelii]